MKLTDFMQKQAIELLNFRIMIGPEFNIIDRRLLCDLIYSEALAGTGNRTAEGKGRKAGERC